MLPELIRTGFPSLTLIMYWLAVLSYWQENSKMAFAGLVTTFSCRWTLVTLVLADMSGTNPSVSAAWWNFNRPSFGAILVAHSMLSISTSAHRSVYFELYLRPRYTYYIKLTAVYEHERRKILSDRPVDELYKVRGCSGGQRTVRTNRLPLQTSAPMRFDVGVLARPVRRYLKNE